MIHSMLGDFNRANIASALEKGVSMSLNNAEFSKLMSGFDNIVEKAEELEGKLESKSEAQEDVTKRLNEALD